MEDIDSYTLNASNTDAAKQVFSKAIDLGISFKMQEKVRAADISSLNPDDFIDALPENGQDIKSLLEEFESRFLPYSYNFASPNFMGFPDAGNSIAAITGGIISDLLQQNLINQSFCSPSGTFAEISVIQWLREVVGYKNPADVKDIFDTGGIITGGGTISNSIGIMLARENFRPQTMQQGVTSDDSYYLIVPKGIGHYSVKSAQMWIGCGNKLIEVETNNYRYDLNDLKIKLKKFEGRIMGLVAYAGDSRTMTVDNFNAISEIVRSSGQNIWLHADACHGFSLGFSEKLRYKISGIENFDSITTDPHKVMNVPYTISALLTKKSSSIEMVSSLSDLIMKEQYAFGQITPFIGSKPWLSLKLWFAIKNLGRSGFETIINDRHQLALTFSDLLKNDDEFVLLNEVDINSVVFIYTGASRSQNVDILNQINRDIHSKMIKEGLYHLHQFSIPDPGIFEKDKTIYPLRFMSGNPNTTKAHLINLINYLKKLGSESVHNLS